MTQESFQLETFLYELGFNVKTSNKNNERVHATTLIIEPAIRHR